MNILNSDHTADNKNVYSSHIVLRDPDIMLIYLACCFSGLISIFLGWELTGFILIILANLLLPHIFSQHFRPTYSQNVKTETLFYKPRKRRDH